MIRKHVRMHEAPSRVHLTTKTKHLLTLSEQRREERISKAVTVLAKKAIIVGTWADVWIGRQWHHIKVSLAKAYDDVVAFLRNKILHAPEYAFGI